MRKVFWCCTAAAFLASGSVYLAAKHIDRHPYDTMAALIGGGTSTASCPAVPTEGAVPAEPTPAEGPEPSPHSTVPMPPRDVVVRTDGNLAGEIAIEEGGSPMASCKDSAGGGEEMPANPKTIDSGSLIVSGTLTPPMPCPAVMPYCPDDEASSRRMPYADEEQCEESANDSMSWLDLIEQAIREAVEVMPAVGSEEMPIYKCPEDEYHRQHSQTCPYSGRTYPSNYVPCPAVPGAEEEKKADESEKKSDEAPKTKGSGEEQDLPPPLTDLDTMEFRPSDAGFERFTPDGL